jgi:hypothetical protein
MDRRDDADLRVLYQCRLHQRRADGAVVGDFDLQDLARIAPGPVAEVLRVHPGHEVENDVTGRYERRCRGLEAKDRLTVQDHGGLGHPERLLQ